MSALTSSYPTTLHASVTRSRRRQGGLGWNGRYVPPQRHGADSAQPTFFLFSFSRHILHHHGVPLAHSPYASTSAFAGLRRLSSLSSSGACLARRTRGRSLRPSHRLCLDRGRRPLAPYKRHSNRYAVLFACIDLEVGSYGQVVHVGVAQKAEHRLPRRKKLVISQLEAIRSIVDRVQDEDSFNIQEIGWRSKPRS